MLVLQVVHIASTILGLRIVKQIIAKLISA